MGRIRNGIYHFGLNALLGLSVWGAGEGCKRLGDINMHPSKAYYSRHTIGGVVDYAVDGPVNFGKSYPSEISLIFGAGTAYWLAERLSKKLKK